MIKLKNKNRIINFINEYCNSNKSELYQVYNKCSNAKTESFESIKTRMGKEGGTDLRILSANCYQYTCGYKLENNLIIDTSANTYLIENWDQYK